MVFCLIQVNQCSKPGLQVDVNSEHLGFPLYFCLLFSLPFLLCWFVSTQLYYTLGSQCEEASNHAYHQNPVFVSWLAGVFQDQRGEQMTNSHFPLKHRLDKLIPNTLAPSLCINLQGWYAKIWVRVLFVDFSSSSRLFTATSVN